MFLVGKADEVTGLICRTVGTESRDPWIPTWADRSPRWSTPPKTPGAGPDKTLLSLLKHAETIYHLGVKTLGPFGCENQTIKTSTLGPQLLRCEVGAGNLSSDKHDMLPGNWNAKGHVPIKQVKK